MAGKSRSNKIVAKHIETETIRVDGNSVAGGLLLGSTEVIDLNGEADSLVLDADGDTSLSAPTDDQIDVEVGGSDVLTIVAAAVTLAIILDMNGNKIDLDADADTSIHADTDDQIDIEIAGADDFRFVANIFRALPGSSIETDTLNETTSAAGVTIDGVLLKDGGIVCADAATLEVDTVNEATAAAGVTADGVLLKDGASTHLTPVVAVTGDGAISIPAGNTTYFITENIDGAAMTLVDPTATTHDGLTLTFIATTAQAHALDNSAGSGFNGVGAGADVGTFGGAVGDMIQLMAYQGVWYVTINTNVTLG
jgi:hypothetical protein